MRDLHLPPPDIEARAHEIDPDAWCSSDSQAGAYELRYRRDDARVLAAVEKNEGGRWQNIVDRLGDRVRPTFDRDCVRRIIAALERAGKIVRHPRYSAVNSIYWVRA